ncbi:MAG: VWA domain-containing protein, partial [Acidobacteria bacterium]
MIAFSHPWALLLALPAAWLLWRARRPDVETREVGNVFLWLDSPLDPRAAAQAGRPLPPWLVWLQAAVLVLVAAAISWPSRPDPRPAAALILDVSMSMSARTGDASRIESARAAAKQWLSAQPRRSAVSVIAAGARAVEAEVVEAGSPGAADAIDRLDATDASGELADAIALARRRTSGRVAVITDLPAPATIDRTVEWRQIGGPADNVAITNLAGTEEGGAIAEVTNFGAAARRASLAIDGGAAPRREQFEIGPAEVRAFLIEPGPDRTLSATLTVDGNSGNAISRDDRRSAEIRRVKRLNVVLIGDQPMIAAALR